MTSLHAICGLGPPNQKSWLRLCMCMQLCTGFNDCKFAITQAIKFGIAKLPKTFGENTEKSLNAKKKTITKS